MLGDAIASKKFGLSRSSTEQWLDKKSSPSAPIFQNYKCIHFFHSKEVKPKHSSPILGKNCSKKIILGSFNKVAQDLSSSELRRSCLLWCCGPPTFTMSQSMFCACSLSQVMEHTTAQPHPSLPLSSTTQIHPHPQPHKQPQLKITLRNLIQKKIKQVTYI